MYLINKRSLAVALFLAALSLSLSGVMAQSATDYDSDDDGLIEVANLAQLNAIRWDMDGNGGTASGHRAAFPAPTINWGCPSTCSGYELTTDLDFDGDGDLDSDDDYWNDGNGFKAMGAAPFPYKFTATFDGNGHTIKNLRVRHSDATFLGLFAELSGKVRDLGLEEVYINPSGSGYIIHHAGAVAGIAYEGSQIREVAVRGGDGITARSKTATTGHGMAGGDGRHSAWLTGWSVTRVVTQQITNSL